MSQTFKIELDREEDGRWIADVPELPGVLVYGDTREHALQAAEALALRVIADKIEQGELRADPLKVTLRSATAA
jgi:predicted RNase H-like HicB family nuclease